MVKAEKITEAENGSSIASFMATGDAEGVMVDAGFVPAYITLLVMGQAGLTITHLVWVPPLVNRMVEIRLFSGSSDASYQDDAIKIKNNGNFITVEFDPKVTPNGDEAHIILHR